MITIKAEMDFCCEKFQKANQSGLIFLGVLAPNVKSWMSERERMLKDRDLRSHVNFAGADGVTWRECPYCMEKL